MSEWIREAWSTNQVTGAMCTWPGLRVKSYSILKRLVALRLKLKPVSFRRIRLDSNETWIELFILQMLTMQDRFDLSKVLKFEVRPSSSCK